MQVDGYLHLYTTLIGWHHYGLLWNLLTGVGLVFLPILGIVFDHLSDVRSQGSMLNTNPDGALAGLEVKLFTTMLVVLVAAVPTSFTTLTPGELQFTAKSSVYGDAATATTTDSQSTWDTSTVFDGYDFTDAGVNVPAFWFLLMQVSQGLKYAMLNATDARGESYRALKRMVAIASIENPELRWHVNTFYTHCYAPAVNRYRNQTLSDTNFIEPDANLNTTPPIATVGPDIHWIGSEYFNEKPGFYQSIQVPVLVKGFTFDATRNTEYTSAQAAGSPMCNKYWTKIRDAIYSQDSAQDFITYADRAQTWLPGFLGGTDTDQLKNEVAQMFLHNTSKKLTLTADQLISMRNAGSGTGQSVIDFAANTLQAINLTQTAVLVDIGLDAFIHALAIGQAYILMTLYLFLPIGLLVSRYSISFLMQAGILIFTVSFWTVLWALAAWIDNIMASAIWGSQTIVGTLLDSGPEGYNKRIIHSIAIGFLYILGPLSTAWILAAAGSRISYALSAASGSAGMAIGASSRSLTASSASSPSSTIKAWNLYRRS